jgi:hypothetical protein
VTLADKILARVVDPRPTGRGTWRARCPCPGHAHGDRRPSLDIREAPDGKVLVLCRSLGHRYGEVLAALGLSMSARPGTTARPGWGASPMGEARREILAAARRQVRELYALADRLRLADAAPAPEAAAHRTAALAEFEAQMHEAIWAEYEAILALAYRGVAA